MAASLNYFLLLLLVSNSYKSVPGINAIQKSSSDWYHVLYCKT